MEMINTGQTPHTQTGNNTKKFKYGYKDIARLSNLSVFTLYQYKLLGILKPDDLESVFELITYGKNLAEYKKKFKKGD